MSGPWRTPAEESHLYPRLCLSDNRVTGSITIGCSRLPVWAIVTEAVRSNWESVEAGWSPTEHYGFTEDDLANFLYDLMEQRGEFGRLLLVLADVERRDRGDEFGTGHRPWWKRKKRRNAVADQLRRCLAVLEEE